LLPCSEEITPAIEVLLSEYLDAIIHQGDKDFSAAVDWSKENTEKGMELLRLRPSASGLYADSLEHLSIYKIPGLRPLKDTVSPMISFNPQLSHFLEGFYVADQLDARLVGDISLDCAFKGIV